MPLHQKAVKLFGKVTCHSRGFETVRLGIHGNPQTTSCEVAIDICVAERNCYCIWARWLTRLNDAFDAFVFSRRLLNHTILFHSARTLYCIILYLLFTTTTAIYCIILRPSDSEILTASYSNIASRYLLIIVLVGTFQDKKRPTLYL